jgi:hypothetical protein
MFNILDFDTWEYASDSVFVLNGKTVIEMDENAEAFTEKNMVKAITDVIRGISRNDGAKEKIQKKGRKNIIERLINNMDLGMSFTESVDEMIHWLNSSGDESGKFDIFDFDSWKYASLRPFFWKDKKLFSAKDGKALTEEDIVELFQAIFGFLERNGDKISREVKQNGINNGLNRMAKCQSDPDCYIMQQGKIPKGIFNPRDPDTYQFAADRPLVIDGVRIFRTFEDMSGKETREYKTEKEFSWQLLSLLETYKNNIVLDEAIRLVKSDFQRLGEKEPNLDAPEYAGKVNKIYGSILKDPAVRLTKKQEKEYIDNHIKRKLAECAPQKLVNHGGYGFSEAQLEVLDGLPVETVEKIGKILSSDKSGSKLKQEIFDSLGIDGLWVVNLRYHDPIFEENIMHDYYLGFEDFNSKQDVYDFFNSRPYLEKRTELKEKVIEDVIELQFGGE